METRKAYIAHSYEIDVPVHIGRYHVEKMIGTGAFSVVALVRNGNTGQKFACKVYSREFMMRNGYYALFERELRIFQFLSHPNIVKFEEVIYGKELIFVVMELCNGDLFEFINVRGSMDEISAVKMFRELVGAVNYLHNRDITHRDLKPENILMNNNSIKVSDFGFCEEMRPNELLTLSCGSEYYAAPEVVGGIPYDGRKCDVWSLGVILYSMVAGFLPWDLSGKTSVFEQGENSDFDIPPFFTPELKHLVKKMLDPNPLFRPTCDEILKHPWLRIDAGVRPKGDVRRNSMFDVRKNTLLNGSRLVANVRTKTTDEKFQDILRRPVVSKKNRMITLKEPKPTKVTWTAVDPSPLIWLRRSSLQRPS